VHFEEIQLYPALQVAHTAMSVGHERQLASEQALQVVPLTNLNPGRQAVHVVTVVSQV
jgi:hypothetical protein